MSRDQAPFAERLPRELTLELAFLRLCRRNGCLWLDSSAQTRHLDPGSSPLGRFSFLTSDPIQTLSELSRDSIQWPDLHKLYKSLPQEMDPNLPPFQGGLAGLWGYEAATWLENIDLPPSDFLSIPAISVGLYDWTLAADHLSGESWLICQGEFHPDWDRRCELASQRAAEVKAILQQEPSAVSPEVIEGSNKLEAEAIPSQHMTPIPGIQSNFARSSYPRSVEKVVDSICNGDSFQVNLSQRLITKATSSAAELYLKLREVNAAPFSAYYHQSDYQIASSSPEGFLQVRGRQVETRPIKGTVRRTGQEDTDRGLAEQLIASEKDRAENIMIVDLLRNDLSKSCEDDSVVVTKLCGLEIYEHVQHLGSVVQGKFRENQSASQLLESCFPGGSVTGAPKVEAMKTIAELEPNRRGAYCGSIGYLGVGSQADFNILIRTITAKKGYWQFPVGGGITARSEPDLEEAETWTKAEGMIRATQQESSKMMNH